MKFMDVRVVAVVVTHNRPEELLLVVAALQGQTRVPDRIIVLDNASSTHARNTLSDLSDVDVVRNEVNSGGAGGFALGVEASLAHSPDWIWLMDDDAVPRPDALELLLSAKIQEPKKVGALCSAVYEFGALAPLHRRNFSKLFGWEQAISPKRYLEDLVQIDTGSFVGFLVNTNAVCVVGLPNSDFFLAYDDTEYSLRLMTAGYANWLIPASKIDHLRSPGARLRSSPFGSKHFYNVRNRLAVVLQYAQWKTVATCIAILVGFSIWLVCGGIRHPASIHLLHRAIRNGLKGKLGVLK